MPTSLNNTNSARDAGYQLVHFLRKRLNVAADGLVTTVPKALGLTLPANAAIVPSSGVWVTTNFGGTTNTLDIGYAADATSTADGDAYATALVMPLTTAGFVPFDEIAAGGITARPRTVDTALTATFTGTSTTGAVDIIVAYVLLS